MLLIFAPGAAGAFDVQPLFEIAVTAGKLLGAGLIVFGVITLAMAWREGFSGGGQQLSTGIGTIVCGVMITAASIYFSTIGQMANQMISGGTV